MEVVSTVGFDAGLAWCEANPDKIVGGYAPSKQLTNAWVAFRAVDLIKKGIRLNCTNPGPTDHSHDGSTLRSKQAKELIDAFVRPLRASLNSRGTGLGRSSS